jgi:hypothetical protein
MIYKISPCPSLPKRGSFARMRSGRNEDKRNSYNREKRSTSVMSLTDLYIIFFRHSRGNGNPVALILDSCFRRNDR